MKSVRISLPAIAIGLLLSATSQGMFMAPQSVPIKRLREVAAAAIKSDPKSAEAHYTLARIDYLAFVCTDKKLDSYPGTTPQELPTIGPFQRFTEAGDGDSEEVVKRAVAELKLDKEPEYGSADYESFKKTELKVIKEIHERHWKEPEIADDIAEAHAHFQQAMALDPKCACYRLGYASLREQAVAWAALHPEAKGADEWTKISAASVRDEYAKVWTMELAADLKDKENRGAMNAMDMISYEAGSAFVRLAETDAHGLSAAEKTTLARVRKSLTELEKGSGRTMTPIVFSMEPVTTIGDLLAPETTVDFPLRGYGPKQRWPWIKPGTALLVWNPSHSGEVESGAQLFGSYTWELFWKTGYEPLAVLDIDGDGQLSGAELEPLAAWFDRNSNGIAEPGEVQTLAALGVTSLATRATGAEGPHPMNASGITFADGSVRPTWDWVTEPAAAASQLAATGF